MTHNTRLCIVRSEPTMLVSIVASHRRDHSCAGEPRCPKEEELIETLVDAAKSSEDMMELLKSPAVEPPPVSPDDALMEAAARYRAAVETQKIQRCAGALYYSHHSPQERSTVAWSMLAYDERQRYLNDAATVLAAADDFIRTRRV